MAAMSTRKLLTLNPLSSSPLKQSLLFSSSLSYSTKSSAFGARNKNTATEKLSDIDDNAENDSVPTSGISRPLSEILKELNKKVPDTLVSQRVDNGFSIKYVPWHIVNRIMNLHAPEWSGEVRNVTYSPDSKSVSVVYRVTLYGTDAELYRESTGTAALAEIGFGDPVQKAEAMAFRRACARFGLGLHLYHEDMC